MIVPITRMLLELSIDRNRG